MGRHSAEKEFIPFVIPQLEPDTEPVEARDEFASTNPGTLGFNIPQPRPASERTTQSLSDYESNRRRAEHEHFMELAERAEQDRNEQRAQYSVARHALQTTVQPPLSPNDNRTQGFHAMER